MALISHREPLHKNVHALPLSGLCLSVACHHSRSAVAFSVSVGSAANANKLHARQPRLYSEFRSCVKVEVAVLGSPSE